MSGNHNGVHCDNYNASCNNPRDTSRGIPISDLLNATTTSTAITREQYTQVSRYDFSDFVRELLELSGIPSNSINDLVGRICLRIAAESAIVEGSISDRGSQMEIDANEEALITEEEELITEEAAAAVTGITRPEELQFEYNESIRDAANPFTSRYITYDVLDDPAAWDAEISMIAIYFKFDKENLRSLHLAIKHPMIEIFTNSAYFLIRKTIMEKYELDSDKTIIKSLIPYDCKFIKFVAMKSEIDTIVWCINNKFGPIHARVDELFVNTLDTIKLTAVLGKIKDTPNNSAFIRQAITTSYLYPAGELFETVELKFGRDRIHYTNEELFMVAIETQTNSMFEYFVRSSKLFVGITLCIEFSEILCGLGFRIVPVDSPIVNSRGQTFEIRHM